MNQLMDGINSNINGLLFIASFFVLPLHLLDILNHFSVDSISMISNNVLRLCKSKKYV